MKLYRVENAEDLTNEETVGAEIRRLHRTNSRFPHRVLQIAALFVLLGHAAHATAITTWNIARDSSAGSVNSGLNTDSPTFGDGTSSNIRDAFVTGEFGQTVSLAVGEILTVSYDINYTGGVSNLVQYRFVVGDYGATADQNWNGGWNFVTGEDLYQGRTDGNVQSTAGNSEPLGATETVSGTFSGDSTEAYTYTFSITRTSATTVDLVGSLVGGDGSYSLEYVANNISTSLFDYNGVGLLFGATSNLDQASLSGAQFAVIPEPSTFALFGGMLALGLVALRRQRRKS